MRRNRREECFPGIKIASQIESDLAIANLSKSPIFASTHIYIAQLDKFDLYPRASRAACPIPSQNNQVGWVIADRDVHAFYAKLLSKYETDLKAEDRETLAELVEKGKPEEFPF